MEINVKGNLLHPAIGSFMDNLRVLNHDVTVEVTEYKFCGRVDPRRVQVSMRAKDLALVSVVNCDEHGLTLEDIHVKRSGANVVAIALFSVPMPQLERMDNATTSVPVGTTLTSSITAEQYDAGHSMEGVTAIDFGPVSAQDARLLAERTCLIGSIVADAEPLPEKTLGIWHPMRERYTENQLPGGFDFYCLLDGENGPMLGNIYQDRQHPREFLMKVSTPTGLIDATLLGCKHVCFVRWSADEVAINDLDA